ncbi:MAG: hypothetical protein M3Y72_18230 [Acidobacteriota bacterium]|nr:hypothetical protein [Acidobacteriota bacterium]
MRNAYRMGWLASFALVICFCWTSAAQTQQSVAGEWALPLGERTLFVLSVRPSDGKDGPYPGSLSRPTHLQTADAVSFSHVEGPTVVEPLVASGWKGDSLSITVQNPKDSSDKTVYLLHVKDETHADLQIVGAPFPPLKLIRATEAASVSEGWLSGQTYSPDDDAPSNPEMKRIFEEDQRVRQSWPNIDWSVVEQSDALRRVAVMKLLNAGVLHSGEDFEWAANVFQHGSSADDYLLAHTLAVIAIRKGYSDATWIAAATLDRYLQSINQPQIYGTQFATPSGVPATQKPYNRALIPDPLRRQLGVPTLAAQKVQQQQYDSKQHIDGHSSKP